MLNHEKYIPYIDEWQFSLSNKSKNLLEDFIKKGGKMLAFHTSSICFDDWDGWTKLLGGKWDWDKSFHPPIEKIEVSPIKNHLLGKSIENFKIKDEVYHNLKIEKNSQPFLSARSNTTKEDHIIGWTSEYQKGRTVYNALGHDSESLKNPFMINIIKNSLLWLSGDEFVRN
jgi:type 1 glutamine amidotransferase